MNRSNKGNTLFVTVGSTKFEPLIDKVLTSATLGALKTHSFTKLKLQVGSGNQEDPSLKALTDAEVSFVKEGVEVTAYRYKGSLKQDMLDADLIISHAGSGSVMESLEAGKKLIVVVNDQLMDNHQLELAEKMCAEGYLLYTKCDGLEDIVHRILEDGSELVKYSPGNAKLFGNYLNKMFA